MRKFYSPLRYPGGKGKLAAYFLSLLEANGFDDGSYVEPYAGGAGIALTLLIEGAVKHIHLNDLNYPLYCFWHSVINDTEGLLRKLKNSKVTVESWKRHRRKLTNPTQYDSLDVGFALLFLNRTNRSGIINGSMIGGYEQAGDWKMDARFYKSTLSERITRIALYSNSISIYNLDAIEFLSQIDRKLTASSLIYIDPPYYKKGHRLYDNFYSHGDHVKVAKVIKQLSSNWLVSYDNVKPISELYRGFRQLEYSLAYSAGISKMGRELMVYSDMLKLPNPNMPIQTRAA
jgi:DNA adenine methylase